MLSLRKHRTIRSNIRRTTARLLLAIQIGGFALFAVAPGTIVMADKILPPVDVTESESSGLDDSDTGRVSLSTLPPASDFVVSKPEASRPLPAATPARPKQSEAAQTSRELMNALRQGVPAPVRPLTFSKPASKTAAPRSQPVSGMQMNAILQTAGQEDEAGVISIPQLTEELPPVPEIPQLMTPQLTYPAPSAPVSGRRNMKQLRKDTRKSQRKSRGNRFIEFYDPELERLDVDDYDREILLISDTDQTELAPAPSLDSEVEEAESGGTARRLFKKDITTIKPTLAYAWGNRKGLPEDFDRKMDEGEYVARVAPRTVLQWEPTNLWYHPLYFEDVGLERYGHSHKPWLQPFVSSGRFFGQVAMLPYQMTLHPPKAKEFALGHYQPGEWAPKKRYRIPFNEEASAVEFLWITGLVLLIP